jgi:hypothetical protein
LGTGHSLIEPIGLHAPTSVAAAAVIRPVSLVSPVRLVIITVGSRMG